MQVGGSSAAKMVVKIKVEALVGRYREAKRAGPSDLRPTMSSQSE